MDARAEHPLATFKANLPVPRTEERFQASIVP